MLMQFLGGGGGGGRGEGLNEMSLGNVKMVNDAEIFGRCGFQAGMELKWRATITRLQFKPFFPIY